MWWAIILWLLVVVSYFLFFEEIGMNAEERELAQKDYVKARIGGATQDAALQIAGYSPKTSPQQLEKVGGPVHTLMVKALAEKGITEDFVAKEYHDGIAAAMMDGAKEKDLNAHAQYLKQLGYLLGYGKNNPSVAVQINNSYPGQGEGDGPAPTRELIEEVAALVDVLKAEVGRDRHLGVLPHGAGAADTPACPGVDGASTVEPAPSGGGGA